MSERLRDLDQLEADREAACVDKSDLFDFYNSTWDDLLAELRACRAALSPEIVEALEFARDLLRANPLGLHSHDPVVVEHNARCAAALRALDAIDGKATP